MVKKALFWDFDGTLILPNESFLDALQHALKPFNYSVNPETIRISLRSACPWYHPEKSYTDTTGVNWWDHFFESFEGFYMEHSIADSDREKINQLFKEYILNDKNYTVYPDADMVLHQCHGMGYKNYILTNNFPELAVIAKRIGLSKHIDDYIISTNIGFEKPRPELFQYALRIANVPDTGTTKPKILPVFRQEKIRQMYNFDSIVNPHIQAVCCHHIFRIMIRNFH